MDFMDAATARKMAKEGWDAKVKAQEADILRLIEYTASVRCVRSVKIKADDPAREEAMRNLMSELVDKGYHVDWDHGSFGVTIVITW